MAAYGEIPMAAVSSAETGAGSAGRRQIADRGGAIMIDRRATQARWDAERWGDDGGSVRADAAAAWRPRINP
jgi:hypothetical protein